MSENRDETVMVTVQQLLYLAGSAADGGGLGDREAWIRTLLIDKLGKCEAQQWAVTCQRHSGHTGSHNYTDAGRVYLTWDLS